MKRFLAAILSVSLLGSVTASGIFSAYAEGADSGILYENERESSDVGQNSAEDELILPSTYEQYLPLSEPSDVSAAKNHTAIADGNKIYVYDRKAEEYRCYEHTANADESKNDIAKLQFSEEGLIYFLDASTYLYTLDPETLKEEKTNLVCSTFTIFSDILYFTNVSSNISQISKTTLDKLDSSTAESVVNGIASKPAIAQDNGVLYYTDAGKYLHKVDSSNDTLIDQLTTDETVVSLAVYSGILYYTDTAETLYVYDLTTNEHLNSFEGGYSALSVSDGYIYAVKNDSVRQYSPTDAAFTEFEICESSASPNRLSGASDTILAGNKLFFADNGNKRISSCDTETGEMQVFPIEIQADFIASDGDTVLAANAAEAVLYDSDGGEKIASFSGFNSNLVGAAAVYGKYYFITDNNYFYCAEQNSEGIWTLNSTPKPSASHTARLLAADVYGALYVAYSDGSVYRFEEDEFMAPAEVGEKTATVPVQAEKIAVDYEETVCALYKNELYVCADAQKEYSLSKTAVYGQTAETKVLSFTFGIETGDVYLLYEGDFVLSTRDIPLPTVRTIEVGGADEDIFSEQSAEFSVVKTAEKGLMVTFDIGTLSGAEYFPYLSYSRETESHTALKLGETDKYNLIAVFDETDKTYSTALILKRYCEEIPESEYLTPAEGFTDGIGYLTNSVKLYKYPYLTSLLTVTELEKNTAVKVLGKIDTLDYRYYYVSYTDTEGTVRTGYIPQGYVANFDGAPPESQNFEVGAGNADHDSLWRLAFLLLGCASICVLTDYLILHKRKP